jgi:DNA-directed RNA polymerase specialized sigma24 family protein
MNPFRSNSQAERQSRSRGPSGTQIDDSIATSDDLLFDFFDFFDSTVDDVYTYILHRTRNQAVAEEITLDVYYSLLQRRRFLWWRNVAEIATLLPVAEKAIAAMPSWSEKELEDLYMEELGQCVPDAKEEATLRKLEAVKNAIKELPVKEQCIAIMRFFLRWKPEKAALIAQKSVAAVEKIYESVLHSLIQFLGSQDVFREVSVEAFLRLISCPPLASEAKARLRVAILEKYRAGQMSNVRFAVPVAALLLVGYTAFSTLLLPPISGRGITRQIAAMEVLILKQERDYRDAFLKFESTYRTYTAHFAEKDLARITVDFLPQAIVQQVELEDTVNTALRELGTRPLIISTLLAAPKAHAESL